MGIGPFVGALWVLLLVFSVIVYALRYRHQERLLANTACILFLVVTFLGFVGMVEFFPEFAFDPSRGSGVFSALLYLVPTACVGVLIFSILEWRMARLAERNSRTN